MLYMNILQMSFCVVRLPVNADKRPSCWISLPRPRFLLKRIPRRLTARDPGLENVGSLKQGFDSKEGSVRPVLKEIPVLLKLCTPAFFHGIFTLSLPTIIAILVGRLGTMELSVTSLALSFYYLLGASVIEGLTVAVEILGGQAHGAGNQDLVDLTLRRGWLLSMITCGVVSLLWSRSESIFLRLGQDPQISKAAARVLHWMIPYFFVDATLTCLTKSLASRNIVRPTMIACGISTAIAPVLAWFLILRSPLGIYGAPVALLCVSAMTLLLITALKPKRLRKLDRSLKNWWKEWSGFRTYLTTTLPCFLTVCCEWWTFEIFAFLAGLVPYPEVSLGIMGAANSVVNAIFLASLSLAGGTIVRVSNNLGAGNKTRAITSAKTGLFLILIIESMMAAQLCWFAPVLGRAWFTDSMAAKSLAAILPLVALTEWASGIGYVMGGILRSCNRGIYELMADFSSYWLVALPLGTALGFACGMSIKGFWIGMAVASIIQFATLSWILLRLNIDTEIERARKLVL